MSFDGLSEKSLLTSHQVSRLLQVSMPSISNWAKKGWLKSHRTPGGHLRVRVGDLVEFLERREIPFPEELSCLARRRVVVVDSDKRFLGAMKRSLRSQKSLEARFADNTIAGLLEVGSFRPKLLLVEVDAPGIPVPDVCQGLKRRSDTKDVEIVVTGRSFSAAQEKRAIEFGADRVLAKPFRWKDAV